MDFFNTRNSEKGQILLIVILAAVVSLTVGLSAVSRTITNTRVTTEEANSQKALSAAEAGIEELVSSRSTTGRSIPKTNLSNNSSFEAGLTPIRSNEVLLNGGSQVLKDDGADVWMSTYPDFTGPWSGNLTIYYSDNDGCSVSGGQTVNPAIEVVVINGNRATPTMTRLAYDACPGAGRRASNNFSAPSNGSYSVLGQSFNHSFAVNGIANGYIARVIPLYANTRLAVSANSQLPSQGNNIDSVGTSGNTTRKIKVFQGWPRIPIEFFPYSIFLP